MGDWGRKPETGINQWKSPEFNKEMWKKNQKIVDIVDEQGS